MLKEPYDPRIGHVNFFFNMHEVRGKLKSEAIARCENGEKFNYYHVDTPTNYYLKRWRVFRALNILKECYLEIEGNTNKGWNKLYLSVLEPDMMAVGHYAAFYAWTVINDEDRLEAARTEKGMFEAMIAEDPDRYKNLSYGLITQHFAPIYRAAQYLSGWTVLKEDMDLPDDKHQQAHEPIMSELYEHFNKLTKEQIDNEISQVCVSISSEDYNAYY